MKLTEMSAEELASFKAEVQKKYDDFKAQGLSLNMARGKPSAEQLDLTEGLLTAVKSSEDCFAEDGTDCRNYGGLDGLPEAKALFAPMLGVTPDELIIAETQALTSCMTLSQSSCFSAQATVRSLGRTQKSSGSALFRDMTDIFL